ncbi:sulfatase-like hydrolase/transferase [Phycisphaerales bacterium AB-hyl4]|uniref:Sulfatase-like hydrolase/transferase n=1 Tax=Natronomicrosphaera hydrolytica TaxID=3242702 RepID=A0ABV4U9P7_9BACT
MAVNILLTVADDQRHAAMGCCDDATADAVRTPHLDALAARGIRFTRAYHAGSAVPAVCMPSRALLHTGCNPNAIPPDMMPEGYVPEHLHKQPDAILGQSLQSAGYHTHHIGKWHNHERSFRDSFTTGKAIFFGGMDDHFHLPLADWDSKRLTPRTEHGCHGTDVFATEAEAFLESYADGAFGTRPFFLHIAFTAPHDPRQTHAQWHERYPVDAIELPPNFQPRHRFDNGALRIRDEMLTSMPRDPRQTHHELANYYAMVEHMDHGIGRIHGALRELGLEQDTLVIHTSDHGLAVGQHGLMGKQNLYEHSIRVPLILAGPGVPTGQQRSTLCYQHDLHPTLIEAGRCETSSSGYFRSLWPSIVDPKANLRDLIETFYSKHQRAAVMTNHKFIEYSVRGNTFVERHDLDADPWEMNPHTLSGDLSAALAS